MNDELFSLARKVGEFLTARMLKLVTAESCTGGKVADVITSVPGSANWFERGFVTYSNESKQELLGVKAETIATYGAVSIQAAKEMVEGALKNSHAQVAIAVTGIAGPGGGSVAKPVGTVCFAWGREGSLTKTGEKHFNGERNQIRRQATDFVLRHMLELI